MTTAQLLANLRGQIEKGIRIGAKDPFRFGFAWDQWDTTTHGAGLTVMADEYDALAGRPVYAAWAQRWLDDILGSNAWGVSLIVGDGTVFPDCMQHQVANLAGSLDGQPPVLAGAAVEGPNSFAATGTVPNMRRCAANAPGNIPLRGVQRAEGRVRRQRAVLLHRGAGHRPDRDDPAGLRLAAERSAVVPCAVSR